jgi:hypothetical protein
MGMNKKLLTLAIAGAVATPFAAQAAGSLTAANQDITLSGGVAGGYVYNNDTGRDNITATDALIDLSSKAKTGGVGFDAGIGVLAGDSLASSGSPLGTATSGTGTALQYGWLDIMPTDGLTLQAGVLATNVGYEVVPSYDNGNILRGLVWNNQPAYYRGIRATYSTGNMSVYVEGNKDAMGTGGTGCAGSLGSHCSGSGAGVSGSFGNFDAALNVFDIANGGNIVDVIASTKMGGTTLAANIDYIQKAKVLKTPGTDDNAWAAALYATMAMGANASLPIRVEYVSDGTSGIYGLFYTDPATGNPTTNNAYTVTITPTYNFSDSTFVRAELAYVGTDKKSTYVDDKGALTDSQTILGLQGGLMF